MSITVNNQTQENIYVAITYWGNHASNQFYKVTPGGTGGESWGRSDNRGFIMALSLTQSGASGVTYFVEANDSIVVDSSDPWNVSGNSGDYTGQLNSFG